MSRTITVQLDEKLAKVLCLSLRNAYLNGEGIAASRIVDDSEEPVQELLSQLNEFLGCDPRYVNPNGGYGSDGRYLRTAFFPWELRRHGTTNDREAVAQELATTLDKLADICPEDVSVDKLFADHVDAMINLYGFNLVDRVRAILNDANHIETAQAVDRRLDIRFNSDEKQQ